MRGRSNGGIPCLAIAGRLNGPAGERVISIQPPTQKQKKVPMLTAAKETDSGCAGHLAVATATSAVGLRKWRKRAIRPLS
jgi:hypothetical protein